MWIWQVLTSLARFHTVLTAASVSPLLLPYKSSREENLLSSGRDGPYFLCPDSTVYCMKDPWQGSKHRLLCVAHCQKVIGQGRQGTFLANAFVHIVLQSFTVGISLLVSCFSFYHCKCKAEICPDSSIANNKECKPATFRVFM